MFELGLPLQLEQSSPVGSALDTWIKNRKPAGRAAIALLVAAFRAQLKVVLGLQRQSAQIELAAAEPCAAGFLDRNSHCLVSYLWRPEWQGRELDAYGQTIPATTRPRERTMHFGDTCVATINTIFRQRNKG